MSHVVLVMTCAICRQQPVDRNVVLNTQVKGFNLRKWISANSKQLPKMLDALGKLVTADKLRLDYTE